MPTSDEFAKEEEEEGEEESGSSCNDRNGGVHNGPIIEEDEERCLDNEDDEPQTRDTQLSKEVSSVRMLLGRRQEHQPAGRMPSSTRSFSGTPMESRKKRIRRNASEKCVAFRKTVHNNAVRAAVASTAITYEKVQRHKNRKEHSYRKSLQRKPKAISAAKERRGVKVLGIILGCFTICWTPFFIMYVVVQFCSSCALNPHIEMFITWLGYSNSAMNPIIYTVFNRDYQIALKRLFTSEKKSGVGIFRRPL
ncbi:unnamed protein product [Toxocara canis]|uniref:Tyramine receptor tyra-2 n=1 Tax=Toxocara canis TaxID=6265 RepID=A0A183UL54_TOXCA|nr:unnamed protein product [Toxocara canis]